MSYIGHRRVVRLALSFLLYLVFGFVKESFLHLVSFGCVLFIVLLYL